MLFIAQYTYGKSFTIFYLFYYLFCIKRIFRGILEIDLLGQAVEPPTPRDTFVGSGESPNCPYKSIFKIPPKIHLIQNK